MMKYDDQDQFSLPRKSDVTEFQSQKDLIPSARRVKATMPFPLNICLP